MDDSYNCQNCPFFSEIMLKLAKIEALLQPKKCTAADIEILERLLPAIAGAFGSEAITTKELLMDPGIAGLNLGSHGVIGSLLGRFAEDRGIICGFQIERIGRDHNKSVWKLTKALPSAIEKPASKPSK
jgi:hypothetical protein